MPISRGAEDDGPRGQADYLNEHTRPAWSDATSAGLAKIRVGGHFDRHFHDCNEYWFIFAGKAKVVSEGVEYYLQRGDILCTKAGDEHDTLEVYEDLEFVWFEDATLAADERATSTRTATRRRDIRSSHRPCPLTFHRVPESSREARRPLRIIHVGTGGMGKYWCRSVWPHVVRVGKAEVVAAVDVVPEHFVHATTHLGIPPERCYPSLATAFSEVDADVVAVVVPPAVHEEVIGVALDHGCDVLSEKPIADTMDACCRVAAKVEQTGRKMAVTMNHRFDQDKQSLEAAIHGGEYGRLSYLVHRFTDNCPKFGGWGAAFRHTMADPLLIEGSVHHLDMLRALAGSNARSVFARTWNPPWGEYEGDTTALVSIEMENGVRAFYEGSVVSASTLNGWENDYVRAECEDGTLELDRRRLRVLVGAGPEAPTASDIPLLPGEVWTHELLAELSCDWVSGVRDDHPTSVEDNMQACALLFAALESAHTGEPVDVQAFLLDHRRAAA